MHPAIYISESGGNGDVVGHAEGIDTITISGDDFVNDWDGVELYQSSDRFCALAGQHVNGLLHAGSRLDRRLARERRAPATYYANGADTPGGCGQVDLTRGAAFRAAPITTTTACGKPRT